MRIHSAFLLAAFTIACGSSDSAGGTGTAGVVSGGVCTGNGWRDTCHWLSTCSGGRFELLCSTNDDRVEALLQDAGVSLDESSCACIQDESIVTGVARDESFCSDQFNQGDSDRMDKARAHVEAICGWRL
jgi:hypothetical protein